MPDDIPDGGLPPGGTGVPGENKNVRTIDEIPGDPGPLQGLDPGDDQPGRATGHEHSNDSQHPAPGWQPALPHQQPGQAQPSGQPQTGAAGPPDGLEGGYSPANPSAPTDTPQQSVQPPDPLTGGHSPAEADSSSSLDPSIAPPKAEPNQSSAQTPAPPPVPLLPHGQDTIGPEIQGGKDIPHDYDPIEEFLKALEDITDRPLKNEEEPRNPYEGMEIKAPGAALDFMVSVPGDGTDEGNPDDLLTPGEDGPGGDDLDLEFDPSQDSDEIENSHDDPANDPSGFDPSGSDLSSGGGEGGGSGSGSDPSMDTGFEPGSGGGET